MPTPDVRLLRATLTAIETAPEGWDQERVASRGPHGTVRFGFEGRAINLRYPDALWKWEQDPARFYWEHAYLVAGTPRSPGRHALHVAMEILGLDDERYVLWLGDPQASVAQLAALVDELCELAP